MAFRLHYKCKNSEKIKNIDYTSLYPFVQKYGIYPVAHPTVITEYFSVKIFGINKV